MVVGIRQQGAAEKNVASAPNSESQPSGLRRSPPLGSRSVPFILVVAAPPEALLVQVNAALALVP